MRAGVYVGRASRPRRRGPPPTTITATQGTAPPRRRTTRPRAPTAAPTVPGWRGNGVETQRSFKNPIWSNWSKSGAASAAHRLRSGLPVDRTTPRRLAMGPCDARLARGLPRRAHHHMAAHEQHDDARAVRRIRNDGDYSLATTQSELGDATCPRPSSSAAASSTINSSTTLNGSGRVLRGDSTTAASMASSPLPHVVGVTRRRARREHRWARPRRSPPRAGLVELKMAITTTSSQDDEPSTTRGMRTRRRPVRDSGA